MHICHSASRLTRRRLLAGLGTASALPWLTPLAERLALAEDTKAGAARRRPDAPVKSVIVLWLAGGPSQLDTFDPHPGTTIGGDVKAVAASVPGVSIAATMPRMAERLDRVALVRGVVSKEGDHERGSHTLKTGFRPDPTLVHPALGAILCHQLSDAVEIPRHVSILAGQFPPRGGYLGPQFDAFQIGDPARPIPDMTPLVGPDRVTRRMDDLLGVVETEFARGRLADLDRRTNHVASVEAAKTMMASDQLAAFDVSTAPQTLRAEFGETPFGRGCLTAARLVEVGVRCVEVELGGWDSHIENASIQAARATELDQAFAALLDDLTRRGLLDSTLIYCAGEFGRTPRINPAGGRDHWPHGFSVVLAGGGIRGGAVVGQTNPKPKLDKDHPRADVADPTDVADLSSTILHLAGVDPWHEVQTPVGRPMKLSEGRLIHAILQST